MTQSVELSSSKMVFNISSIKIIENYFPLQREPIPIDHYDAFEGACSFLDPQTLITCIPRVCKNFKTISQSETIWRIYLIQLPERIRSLNRTSYQKCIAYWRKPFLHVENKIKLILSHSKYETSVSVPRSYNAGPWGSTTTMVSVSTRAFSETFLHKIKDTSLSLKTKKRLIESYMKDHYILSYLIAHRHLRNRAALIETSLILGCNPNREITHKPFAHYEIKTTPLHAIAYEALYDQRYETVVRCLLEHGANPHVSTRREGTPRQYIRSEAINRLNHYNGFFVSFFISRSKFENLISAYGRLAALLHSFE